MVREYGVYTAVAKELMMIQMNKSSESQIQNQNYTKPKISKSKKCKMNVPKKTLITVSLLL